jgi:hypothetical protein
MTREELRAFLLRRAHAWTEQHLEAIMADYAPDVEYITLTGQWSHTFVPAQFDGQLINRRKLYPSELRGMLSFSLYSTTDRRQRHRVITQTQAERMLRRTRTFVQAIVARGGEPV